MIKKHLKKEVMLALALCSFTPLFTGVLNAEELAVDPGDVVAQQAGTSVVALYYQNANNKKLFSDGTLVTGNADLETNIGLVRIGRYLEISSLIVQPQFVLPYGNLDLRQGMGNQPPLEETGFGDPIVGATTWLISDPESKTWFGIPFYVSVPVGDYESEQGPFNIGENRWKAMLQAGYAKGLGDRSLIELIAEYAIFGRNDDYYGMTMEQDETISLMGNFSYQITPKTSTSLSYYHTFEGNTQIDGIDQSDRKNNSRWVASIGSWIAPSVHAQLQYGRDLHIENGLKENNRVNLRLAKLF